MHSITLCCTVALIGLKTDRSAVLYLSLTRPTLRPMAIQPGGSRRTLGIHQQHALASQPADHSLRHVATLVHRSDSSRCNGPRCPNGSGQYYRSRGPRRHLVHKVQALQHQCRTRPPRGTCVRLAPPLMIALWTFGVVPCRRALATSPTDARASHSGSTRPFHTESPCSSRCTWMFHRKLPAGHRLTAQAVRALSNGPGQRHQAAPYAIGRPSTAL